MIKRAFFVVLFALAFQAVTASAGTLSHNAIVQEYEREFTTYPYSDPDPIPTMSRFYPYFRYDGFTRVPVQRKWKVVELSNDYLQVLILPEIGGKVWAAIDKTSGKSFVYFNHVVKFRDVSMRGPWTSGGMEANYGIMGHTPNCFSPVDYITRRNADGSVSCIVGTLDLLTRSAWRLEIRLGADEACFSTRSLWHNGSPFEQPYYTWMNVGIKASGNLEFVAPGTHYLGHDGRAFNWPQDPENRHDLSWYNQNDFGSYKSYHVMGQLAEFFGGYWHDEDFGMAHYAAYADKPGRKLWIWGLSREGMIWERLLTDHDGQYVEAQSGRLFNQGAEASSLTPFKQFGLAPYATETWQEYWMPVKGTGGLVTASQWGGMNVIQEAGRLVVRICPARPLGDSLEVFDAGRRLYRKELRLRPLQPVEVAIDTPTPVRSLKVCLGGEKLVYDAAERQLLSRPFEAPANFNWDSAFGHYLKGRESGRQRMYGESEDEFRACLELEPNYAPALSEMAGLANRRAGWRAARDYALQALRVDTYDPAANYQLGLASVGLGQLVDAQEAFSIAGLSAGWRSAANVELAKVFIREHRHERALACVEEALRYDSGNLDALQLRACVERLLGARAKAERTRQELLEIDPLNHFARFEQYLAGMGRLTSFARLIRNELPQETYLELAAWYHNIGLDTDAARVLESAPPVAEALYWSAYLLKDTNRLIRAEAASPAFEFPFRPESIAVLERAAQARPSWQPKYYLALLRWYQGEVAEAADLLKACGEEPRFGPFYAVRAQVCEANRVADFRKAAELEPGQWRCGALLIRRLLKEGDRDAVLAASEEFSRRFPTNDVLSLLRVKALMLNRRYEPAAEILDSLDLLPCEGSTEARALFREANLMLAVARLKTAASAEARPFIDKAREWPERLGAGSPYPAEIDYRLEDWLAYQSELAGGNAGQAQKRLESILAWHSGLHTLSVGGVVRALALKERGQHEEAARGLKDWLSEKPESDLAKWGMEVLEGQRPPLPSKHQDGGWRVLAAWLGAQEF